MKKLLLIVFSLSVPATLIAQSRYDRIALEEAPFDEVYDAAGDMRPAYRYWEQRGMPLSYDPSDEAYGRFVQGPLGDNISVAPWVMLLPEDENNRLRAAADQQVRALTAFFADVVLGPIQAVQFDGVVPFEIIKRIMKVSRFGTLEKLRELWDGRSADEIVYFYGPDWMRNAQGEWKLIEANTGNIGGLHDRYFLPKFYREQINPLPTQINFSDDDYGDYIRVLRRAFPERHIVAYVDQDTFDVTQAQRLESDMEDIRALQSLRDHQIPVFTDWEELRDERQSKGLSWSDLLVINKSGYILDDPFLEGAITTTSPGVDCLLSNKLLLPYLDALIRYYLQEEPILTTQDSIPVHIHGTMNGISDGGRLVASDPRILSQLDLESHRNLILKIAHSNQGKGVHFLEERRHGEGQRRHDFVDFSFLNLYIHTSRRSPFAERARNTSRSMTVQERLTPSQGFGYRVDLRHMGLALGAGRSWMSTVPWARASHPQLRASHERIYRDEEKQGGLLSGAESERLLLTNVSQGASELIVGVVPCQLLLSQVHRIK